MANNPQQPGEYDAVLGGQNQLPENAAVLGGILGVKLRLSHPNPLVRIAALGQALNYGEQGLYLVIANLNNDYQQVQKQAYLLLNSLTETRIQQFLIESDAHLRLGGTTDYTRLRDFLAAGEWKQADKETWRVMFAVTKRERYSWLREEDIDNFPCEDLRTIDGLWVKYSNGRFGFSVQKHIFNIFGVTRESNYKIWGEFGEMIGWKRKHLWLFYEHISFDIKAPEGHLPAFVNICYKPRSGGYDYYETAKSVAFISSRLEKCNI
ncbi:GUN4 domain-containing protein [Nodularia sphaerocarpa]|uniref:GUN4 domain-containing protein n=1 Tax=Nodularia sphaerocarpa TaxID=137816 RepID=UPI001EFB9303|nr:GUN4 domain-containing protein [Nodularia sphaerocarpa]MDB9373900.1 GUN4 domain-containing protein [Nodularia sphaerocarpa CS-585]MDB9376848.1 GUN4 domain-containing protein [Nodularia sphaerocarpa CS-585A2]ULP72208.1 Ycf53-like protein [Nodularia sphaerocarpa UHCC 0038]